MKCRFVVLDVVTGQCLDSAVIILPQQCSYLENSLSFWGKYNPEGHAVRVEVEEVK